MVWPILLSSLFLCVAGGAALGAGLGLTGLITLQLFSGGVSESVTAVYNIFSSFTLSAVPLFVLVGELLVESGLSKKIYGALAPLFEHVPGRLLHTNLALCALFAAVSGSSSATAAAIGAAAYPELSRRGYHKATVIGSLAGAGGLGLLIPPSLSLIIYGALQEVSIESLFVAALLPFAMFALLYVAYIVTLGLLRPELTPGHGVALTRGEVLRTLAGAWPLAILLFVVLGSIYSGLATTTEAAGLGVVAVLLLGVATGELTTRTCLRALHNSVTNFGAIKLIILGAVMLGQSISILGLPREIVEAAAALHLAKYGLVAMITVIYLLLGCFFDGIALMLLTLPFVTPLLAAYGFSPIWLGVYITIMIEIGLIHPPLGVNLYVLAAITRQEVPIGAIAWAAAPYWLLLLVGTATITIFPNLLLLPS